MLTNEETRLRNLRELKDEAGSFAKLADLCETSPAYLSQIHNRLPDSKTGRAKNIGDRLARKLEKGMNKPVGWIDRAPSDTTNDAAVTGVREPAPPDYTDPRRRRLMLAFEAMSGPQIDAMLKQAELTVQTNREIVAALDNKKANAA